MIPNQLKPYQIKQELFQEAMTHRSYVNENPVNKSNERLEFLGDAIIEYLISEALYQKFPEHPEGVLTAMRANLVQTQSLSQIAIELDLGAHLLLAKGEEQAGGRNNPSLLENAFESLVGAIYLSSGLSATSKFLEDHLFPRMDELTLEKLKDAKSLFQEKVQALNLPTPYYQVHKEVGPDHDKIFTIGVYVNNQLWGEGSGKSKQQAQQSAATNALAKLHHA